MRAHPSAISAVTPQALLAYDTRYAPAELMRPDFHSSAAGRAFREWNSASGIPSVAWYTLITTSTFCAYCERFRSIDGHEAHLEDGRCGVVVRENDENEVVEMFTDTDTRSKGKACDMSM